MIKFFWMWSPKRTPDVQGFPVVLLMIPFKFVLTFEFLKDWRLSRVIIQIAALERGRPAPFATSCMVGRGDKRTNNRTMLPALKNNAAAGYQGPVKIELLKGAGLLLERRFQL